MKHKLLIIDDDNAVLDILSFWFADEGFDVKVETGTFDILALLEDFQPDVVLLDYLLNGYTGGDLCQEIRRSPEFHHLPVVIFSALNKGSIAVEDLACDAYVAKPFDLYGLTAQLYELISPVTAAEPADEWA